jgi:hypothetical protein
MTNLPNPFTDSDAISGCASDEAAALARSYAPGAAAEIQEHRFVLDEAKFMFDIGYVPPAARPENFAKYMAMLDALIDDQPLPLFLQKTA